MKQKSIVQSISNATNVQLLQDNQIDLIQKSEQQAISMFRQAAQRVPAYRDFLQKFSLDYKKIKSVSDFQLVPYTTKENYILLYPLAMRCWDGEVSNAQAIAASSGSTGEPLFWPREIEQEVEGAQLHHLILNKVFLTNQYKTLIINGFGLGNWIAGMFTHASLYLTQLNGAHFTLASPGYNQEEIFKIIRSFSHQYEQTILICHPPIAKMLVESGISSGIDWKNLNIKFLTAGEGFSENWRNSLIDLTNHSGYLDSLINIYGSADAGMMGFETPLSIQIRRMTATDHLLNQLLFQSERNPYLYQYNPMMKYFESIEGELAVTMQSTAPLIRYNIHDRGGVVSYDSCFATISDYYLPEHAADASYLSLRREWTLPFVYLFSRDAYILSLLRVNIYPENIKAAVEHPTLQPYLTGRFIATVEEGADHNRFMLIRLELKAKRRVSISLQEKSERLFIQTLKTLNSEYNQVEQKFGQKMHPHLRFHKYHHPTYFPEGKIKKMS